MDGEGLEPEALAKAAEATCARVLYTLPTFQNPTGRTQSRTRREDIARVARAHNLTIVEDDIYAAFAPSGGPAPLSVIAPERSFYISGVSKVLGPGLRTGYVVAPDDSRFDALVRAASVTAIAPPNFGALIATQWIEDGTADQIAAEVCAEMVARRRLAQDILGASVEIGAEASPHVWMPLSALEAERLARRALRAGVEVTPPSAPIVEPSLLSGLRLCLGSASDQIELARALKLIAIVPGERASNDGGGVL